MAMPELVLPAGNMEKLKTALSFGADSVYLGGKEFSLRAYAGNFTLEDIQNGLTFAQRMNKKVYVGVNVFAHNRDMQRIPDYLEELAKYKVDGIIVSDPGILRLAQKYTPGIPITISTQANVTNYESAAFYQDLGAQRVVLARELSFDEINEIKLKTNIEVEIFIHGAMCVSYSGRCLLSYYMTGRSANSGACAHPCRYRYAVVEEKRPGEFYAVDEDERGTYIFNSRDLCLLEYIPRLIEAGIDAFKVEGRMKSPLYVASVAGVYREVIDSYPHYSREQWRNWYRELLSTATRPFTNGFIAGESSTMQDISKEEVENKTDFCGVIKGFDRELGMLKIEQRGNFGPGEDLEILVPGGEIIKMKEFEMLNEDLQPIDRARHAQQTVLIPFHESVPELSILRRVKFSE